MSQAAVRAADFEGRGTPRSSAELSSFRRAIVFGASAGAAEVKKLLDRFGIAILAYADNSAAKQGAPFAGAPVIAPTAIGAHLDGATCVVIASVYQSEIAAQLHELGVPHRCIFPFLSPMFAGHFGRTAFAGAASALEGLRSRLADDQSRAYLDSLIAFRWSMDTRVLRRNARLSGFYRYDAPSVGPLKGDHIVDVGAYNGDSAVAYLERLDGQARISALEPLPQNLRALDETIASHRFGRCITPVPFGAGDAAATAEIDSDDGTPDARATLRGKPGERTAIRIETLDRLFANDRVDFVKIDVEGHDPAVLRGAAGILGRDRPGLAVAAYHAPEHLWEIPALIDRLCPGYRIHLGHHPAAAYECEVFCVHESRAGV